MPQEEEKEEGWIYCYMFEGKGGEAIQSQGENGVKKGNKGKRENNMVQRGEMVRCIMI